MEISSLDTLETKKEKILFEVARQLGGPPCRPWSFPPDWERNKGCSSFRFNKMRSTLAFLARVSRIPVRAANPGSFAKAYHL